MSSEFLDALLSGGADHRVSRTSDGASLKPTDSTEEALKAFQSVVANVEANEGRGYRIFKTHESRDRGGNRVDLVMIQFDENDDDR